MPASKAPRARQGVSDALLQSLQGLLFHMQAAHDLLPARPADAQRALALALESGDATVARSLAHVAGQGVPTPTVEAGVGPHLHVSSRRLVGLTFDQQLRVLREALSLALQHADGKHIEVNVVSRRGSWVISVRSHR